jgi:hypothetical protein
MKGKKIKKVMVTQTGAFTNVKRLPELLYFRVKDEVGD